MTALRVRVALGLVLAAAPLARAACPPAPRPACRTAVEAKLKMVDDAVDDAKDRLAWSWSRGPATTQAEFGDPVTTTTWSLCGWDAAGLRFALDVPPGGVCGGKPCWLPQGTTGWKYRDPARAAAGVQSIRLGGGASGRAKIAVDARGTALPDPGLPLAAPFTVQLLRADGVVCFEGLHAASAFVRNDAAVVSAKTKFDPATPVPPLASAGCGGAPSPWTPGASVDDQLVHDGIVRTFRVHLPPAYDDATPAPVVFLLHGGFGSGAQIEGSANLLEVTDVAGAIVVSPDGWQNALGIRTWNAGGCCNGAVAANIDDVGFVADMIDRLESDACIDRRRVYAAGMSNGAMLSHRLACDLADRIRAIAPVAGTDVTIGCTPARPVPVLEVHGTADRNVPFGGGADCGLSGVDYPSVPYTILRWALRDGCTGAPFTSLQQGDGTCTRQGKCPLGGDVDLCVIPNGGHQWPGGDPPSVSGIGGCPFGYQSETFSAPQVLWDFFAQHPPR